MEDTDTAGFQRDVKTLGSICELLFDLLLMRNIGDGPNQAQGSPLRCALDDLAARTNPDPVSVLVQKPVGFIMGGPTSQDDIPDRLADTVTIIRVGPCKPLGFIDLKLSGLLTDHRPDLGGNPHTTTENVGVPHRLIRPRKRMAPAPFVFHRTLFCLLLDFDVGDLEHKAECGVACALFQRRDADQSVAKIPVGTLVSAFSIYDRKQRFGEGTAIAGLKDIRQRQADAILRLPVEQRTKSTICKETLPAIAKQRHRGSSSIDDAAQQTDIIGKNR
nr:hypothetical protein [Mesorhizobium amorphae]